jgi:CubicO group peptidase (beta-lactamase class C family)
MKKLSYLAALLAFLIACGGGDANSDLATSSTQKTSVSNPTQAAAAATQAAATTTQAAAAATQAAATATQAAATATQAAATATQAAATATQENSKQMLSVVKVPPPDFTVTKGFGTFTSAEEAAFAAALNQHFYSVETRMGISAAIFDGQRLWSGTEGFSRENVAMEVDTPLSVMSSSKTFLSALILKQIDNGLYSLSDRLSVLLSGHSGYEQLNSSIIADATVEELLLMTAGHADKDTTSGGSNLNYVVAKPNWVPSDTLTLTTDRARPPGAFEYSNTSSYLLGLIAQYQSQADLNALYQSELLDRLSIQAGLRPIIEIPDDMALPYADYAKYGGAPGWGDLTQMVPMGTPPGYKMDYFEQDGRLAWSAAGIISTPENMARWAYELMSPSGNALSKASRQLLTASFIDKDINLGGVTQKYGYHLAERKYKLSDGSIFITQGHPGGGGGYGSVLYYSPALDVAVSVVANSELGYQRGQCGDFRAGDIANPLVCTARGLFESIIAD